MGEPPAAASRNAPPPELRVVAGSGVQGMGLLAVTVAHDGLMRHSFGSLLAAHGLAVHGVAHAEQLFERGILERADFVVLALGRERGAQAIEACYRLRHERGFTGGVVIVGDDDAVERRTAAYLACADHYVLESDPPEILLATITGLAHRLELAGLLRQIRFGNIVLEPRARRVFVDGELRRVSRERFEVLHLLISEPGVVRSLEEIAQFVGSNPKAAQRMLYRLAKDLGPAADGVIETVRGVGFGVGLNATRTRDRGR